MKKSILDLGKTLNKAYQKQINGGDMQATCEDLGWNEYTCPYATSQQRASEGYRRCC
ncbi:hypothetical protein P8625_06910 [Tenacibaculum tangerinum]|uniref:Uncharacterized protein n=1 Tax=Tenacibaculum tangerinum TaxID=3038772 RepID=A0ABY8L6H3_9FLAO|nr:hypothetical protein [Tenacibaculum tangerinum]WGH76866.1 hypothetical protein P8625_06910 [Tenacibaculum tangerinum]